MYVNLLSLANLSSSFKRGDKLEWLAILVNLSNENGSIIKSVYFLNLENCTNVVPRCLSKLSTCMYLCLKFHPVFSGLS